MKLSAFVATCLALKTAIAHANNDDTCPGSGVYIIGVRETDAAPGFGMTKELADSLLEAIPGSKAISVDYPAARNYLNNTYNDTSVRTGVNAALKLIKDSEVSCPVSEIVLLGYSQGAHVLADLLCNTDEAGHHSTTSLPVDIGQRISVAILMADPSHKANASYNVGTSTKDGRIPVPRNIDCAPYKHRVRSYCDDNDSWCDLGTDDDVHFSYVKKYGTDAIDYVLSKVEGRSMSVGSGYGMGTGGGEQSALL